MFVYIFISFGLFMLLCVPTPGHTQYILQTPTARYSLYVLKVPLNAKQTNILHFRLKIHQNTTNFNTFVDVSVSVRDLRQKKKLVLVLYDRFLGMSSSRRAKNRKN